MPHPRGCSTAAHHCGVQPSQCASTNRRGTIQWIETYLRGRSMRANRTKQKLLAKQNVWGVFMQLPSPELVEVSALVGYDFVVVDCEHGAISEDMAAHMIRAADAAGITPLVRVPRNEAPTILRYLDRGAQGIMAPQVSSVAV